MPRSHGASEVLPGSHSEPARHIDYIAPHQHAALDIGGLDFLLFPPTQIEVGVTDNPVRDNAAFADLDDMQVSVTPPSSFPLWECRVWFSGTFASAEIGDVQLRLVEDPAGTPVPIPSAETDVAVLGNAGVQPLALALVGTVVVPGGSASAFGVQWATSTEVTAVNRERRIEASLRPYTG